MSYHIYKLIAAVALIVTLPAAAQVCTGDIVSDGRADAGALRG